MSLLDSTLPESISVCGKEVPINTDFRTGILMDECIKDARLSSEEKLETIFTLYFGEDFSFLDSPEAFQQAFDGLKDFHACIGASQYRKVERERQEMKKELSEMNNENGESSSEDGPAIYSFDYDAEYIFSAFYSAYGIDLTEAQLHWWKFQALLQSLPEETQFKKILGYRSYKPDKSMSKEQKRFFAKMKRLYALPLSDSERELNDELTKAIMSGKSLKGLLQ